MNKQELRIKYSDIRKNIPDEKRKEESLEITKELLKLIKENSFSAVLLYAPKKYEVDVIGVFDETDIPVFPSCTALGAMGKHVSTPNPNFQPMNCSFGLIDPLPVIPGQKRIRKKEERYQAVADRALSCIREISSKTGGI